MKLINEGDFISFTYNSKYLSGFVRDIRIYATTISFRLNDKRSSFLIHRMLDLTVWQFDLGV